MVKFSIILIVIAFVLLGATLSPTLSPNNPTILNVMEWILCAPDENIVQEVAPVARRVSSDSNAFVVDQSLLCKTSSGSTYDVTEKLFGIGMTGFLVFLVFGVLFLIIGIIRLASGGNKTEVVTTTYSTPYYPAQKPAAAPSSSGYPATPPANQPSPFTTSPQPAPATSQPPYTSYSPSTGYSTTTAVGTKPPAPSEKFDFDAAATMMSIPKPPPTPPPAASDTPAGDSVLKGRLKQLREAFDAGLISNEEYERSKADLLRDFTDMD